MTTDGNENTLMARRRPIDWKSIVVDVLRRRQKNRCADCGITIEKSYQERVRRISPRPIPGNYKHDVITNLKLVHADCTRASPHGPRLRRLQAILLLDSGLSVPEVAKTLGVDVRSVQRYQKDLDPNLLESLRNLAKARKK